MRRFSNIVMLFTLSIAALMGCGKKQKVIFEAEFISFKNKDSYQSTEIQKECDLISESLSDHLKNGWKVVSLSSKEKLVYHSIGKCIGTEYILEK